MTEPKETGKIERRYPPRFDLIAGNVCLDFVNTLDDRHVKDPAIKPKELLKTYVDLLHFGEDTGLLDSVQTDRLRRRMELDPRGAQEVLEWARELREAIHDVFWALMNKRPVPPAALGKVNVDAQGAASHISLVQVARGPGKGGFEWKYDDISAFDSVLWPLAHAAAELLASDELAYVRACSSKDCQWFFLDTSKNHQRRWCDMTRCGNRAKFQRFYARKKKLTS